MTPQTFYEGYDEVSNNRFIKKSNINSTTVGNLKEVWNIPTNLPVSSQPLIHNGLLFFTDWSGYAYCASPQDGRVIWKIKVYNAPNPAENEGLPVAPYYWQGLAGTGAISNGIWYIASVGGNKGKPFQNLVAGYLYAIDTKSGKIIWSTPICSYKMGGNLSRPLVLNGVLYLGLCSVDEPAYFAAKIYGVEFSPRGIGEMLAFDAVSGRKLWGTQMIGLLPNDPLTAVGAAIWGSFCIDETYNYIYMGTGNNYGPPASQSSDSVICLNSKTGEFVWQYQEEKGDIWLSGSNATDNDFAAGAQLFNVMKDSQSIPAVGIGNKNGTYYVLNRLNGNLLWKQKVATAEKATPGIRGVAAIHDNSIFVWSENGWDEESGKKPESVPITVARLDTNNGSIIWSKSIQPASATTAGILANDVYFVGDITGQIIGYNATDGTELWKHTLPSTSICSDLIVWQNMLFAGTGIPSLMGGNQTNCGVFAFRLDKNY